MSLHYDPNPGLNLSRQIDKPEARCQPTATTAIPLLLAFGAICICVLSFTWLAAGTQSATVGELDRRILLSLRSNEDPANPLGPLWLEEAVRDVTALGSVTVLIIIAFAGCGYFAVVGERKAAICLALSMFTAIAASSALKEFYDRPRPQLVPHRMRVFTQSFPSGHAMLATVTYCTMASILSSAQRKRFTKMFVISSALTLVALIGASRVYLSVHWPSDVLAGWIAGTLWSVVWLSVLGLWRSQR